jgi:hypothetical protein
LAQFRHACVWSRCSTSGERAGVGKRQRHSQFIGVPPEESERMLKDKTTLAERRLKLVAELKYRKLRNRQKRSK